SYSILCPLSLHDALPILAMTVGGGRFVVIVGPSGCGKTSLLMMMAGLRHQTSGTIHIQGRPIDAPDPDRVGVVFQEASLFPWLSDRKSTRLNSSHEWISY